MRTIHRWLIWPAALLIAGLVGTLLTSTVPAQSSKPIVVPAAEVNRRNPVPASKESLDNGRLLYSSQCTMCHGEKGQGKGEIAVQYQIPIPDLTDRKQQARRTDGEYFYIIREGHEGMPAQYERLSDKVKWDLVNYLRTLDD